MVGRADLALVAAPSFSPASASRWCWVPSGRSAASPAPSFAAPKSYATGSGEGPDPPAIADLNGDGKPDLATANFVADTLSVLLNRGDGSFEAKRDYATGAGPSRLQIADLNGDDKPDLAAANYKANTGHTVSVLLNRGDGRFQPKVDYTTGAGPSSVAIGDLNGDGKPDLVTANYPAATLSVLLNRGDGSFEAKHDYATGRDPDSLAIADLNGDGRPDLALANIVSNTVSVLLNRGDGSFQAKQDYASEGSTSYLLRLADLNGDGKPDILFINSVGVPPSVTSLVVFLNKGDGSFQAAGHYRTGRCPESVAIADLNGDGSPDVAVGEQEDLHDDLFQDTLSVFLNKGDGTFKKRSYKAGVDPFWANVVASDLNGDGRPDLATGVDRISVLVNRGDGGFQAKVQYPGRHTGGPLASADLNGDETPDLVTTGHSSLRVLINTPGLCNVQGVVGMTPAAAKRELARVNCRVGKVRRLYSKRVKKGRVISQKPKFGAVLSGGGKVNLVVSRGRRHS